MKRLLPVLLILLFAASCAAGVNDLAHKANAEGLVAGFWRGLWHGMIAPFAFVVSLFSDHVQVYEVHNNGGWYNFGFLTGIGAFWHGGSRGGRRIRVSVQKEK
jgi:hypothetical protein